MQNEIKLYIAAKLNQPEQFKDILNFVEDKYKQGKITLFEFGRLLALLNHYGMNGLEPLQIKSTVNCMVCNKETKIEEIENKLCPNCMDVLEDGSQSIPSYKLEKIERKLNKKLVTV